MINNDAYIKNHNPLYMNSMESIKSSLSHSKSGMYYRPRLYHYPCSGIRTIRHKSDFYESIKYVSGHLKGINELKASKTGYIIGSINKTLKDFNTKIHFNFI